MKKTLLLIACFGFSASALAFGTAVQADAALTPVQGSVVKIVSVHSTVKTEAGMKTTMHVEAVATFSNACMAPASGKELVVTTQTARDNVTNSVTLLQLSREGSCIQVYEPVQRTVVIADLLIADGQPTPLILPVFVVNGVRSNLEDAVR